MKIAPISNIVLFVVHYLTSGEPVINFLLKTKEENTETSQVPYDQRENIEIIQNQLCLKEFEQNNF